MPFTPKRKRNRTSDNATPKTPKVRELVSEFKNFIRTPEKNPIFNFKKKLYSKRVGPSPDHPRANVTQVTKSEINLFRTASLDNLYIKDNDNKRNIRWDDGEEVTI